MAAPLVTDELWQQIEPLIPVKSRRADGKGRPPISARQALIGIVFVLRSGIPWNMLPAEMGCGSGVSCWRRLQEWTAAGVWPALHAKLLDVLSRAGQIDAERVVVDSASVRAVLGGRTRVQTPRIEGKEAANAIR
jgi:transposase